MSHEEAVAQLVRSSHPEMEASINPATFQVIVQAITQLIPILTNLFAAFAKATPPVPPSGGGLSK